MQNQVKIITLLTGLFLGFPSVILAQTPFLDSIDKKLSEVSSNDTLFNRKFVQLEQDNLLLGIQSESAQYKYRAATWDYYTKDLVYRTRVFNWQLESARMTFGVAILIVLCGIVFSGIQFRIAMKHATYRLERLKEFQEKNVINTADDKPDTVTSLKLSTQGVEVSSSILGIIILVLSLAFFYLYLVYVFPIKETNFDMSGLKTEYQEITKPLSASR